MYSSFVDGTKTLTETCCAANACQLIPPRGGMRFSVLEYDDMPNMLKPKSEGGILDHNGTVEVPSNYYLDGTPVKRHLRWGVFISGKSVRITQAVFSSILREKIESSWTIRVNIRSCIGRRISSDLSLGKALLPLPFWEFRQGARVPSSQT